jgi:hypothetical protein
MQGYCGLEQVSLPGRVQSREDVATAVAAALNPVALRAGTGTGASLQAILAAAAPALGPRVTALALLGPLHKLHACLLMCCMCMGPHVGAEAVVSL